MAFMNNIEHRTLSLKMSFLFWITT